jgi:adenosylmethionine-8-amino-7-oxononanoate aminotransferase
MDVITAPSPALRDPDESAADAARRALGAMRELLARHAHETAAVIVEPLVQCAGDMRMYEPAYLAQLRRVCDEFGVHLIADEIAVGFGRTGTLFACEQAGITPDFLCLSKGLTGGFLPLSAVLTTAKIYEAFYDEYAKLNAFLHSHSYTGNALACAAARATLSIFQSEPVIERNRTLAARMAAATAALAEHPHVGGIRQRGMILAIEMVKDRARREPYDFRDRRGLRVYRHALERGALLRPVGNVVYFMPPYVITPEEIDFLAGVATSGIGAATCD